jgi:hypothetical protein
VRTLQAPNWGFLLRHKWGVFSRYRQKAPTVLRVAAPHQLLTSVLYCAVAPAMLQPEQHGPVSTVSTIWARTCGSGPTMARAVKKPRAAALGGMGRGKCIGITSQQNRQAQQWSISAFAVPGLFRRSTLPVSLSKENQNCLQSRTSMTKGTPCVGS